MSWQPSWSRRSWLTADSQRALVVCDEGYGDSPAFLERFAGAGLWHLAEMPRDTKVWPLLETDGQTERSRPSRWVPPNTVQIRRKDRKRDKEAGEMAY